MQNPSPTVVSKLSALSSRELNGFVLGLDVGIASLGWALLKEDGEKSQFVDVGVRTWDAPEDPKSKEPKNASRRSDRLTRNTIRHKRQRLRNMRELFLANGLTRYSDRNFIPRMIEDGEIELGFTKSDDNRPDRDQWTLRADALERKLTGPELAVVLYHIANHRGYYDSSKEKSNKDPEGKILLSALARNEVEFARSGYRTVGEWLAKAPELDGKKRNRDGEYRFNVTRDMLRDEIRMIFRTQRRLRSEYVSEEFEQMVDGVFYHQAPVRSQVDVIGDCTFIQNEKRTTLFAPSFERKRFLDRLHHIRFGTPGSKYSHKLGVEEINQVVAIASSRSSFTYSQLRKLLQIPATMSFKGISSEKEGSTDIATRSKTSFLGTAAFRKAYGDDRFKDMEFLTLDRVAESLAFHNDINIIRSELSSLLDEEALELTMQGIEDGLFDRFKGVASISSEACRRLLPHLEGGVTPYEAEKLEGFTKNVGGIPDIEKIGNPVVRKAVTETLKVVIDIVRKHGRPQKINVELARDFGLSRQQRADLERGMNDAADRKIKLREEFSSLFGREPTSKEHQRFSLWKSQNGACLYSGEGIKPDWVVDGSNNAQIDHILPFSRFYDDSFHNKALVLSRSNADKRDRTPYEYIVTEFGEEAWMQFARRIEATKGLPGMKKRNLLLVDASEKEDGFRSRQLNDTRYIAKTVLGILDCLYASKEGRSVFARPGRLTGLTRRLWGLNDLKYDGDERIQNGSHHAVDAMVVAAITEGMMQRMSRSVQAYEATGRESVFQNVAQPWAGFRTDVEAALSAATQGGRMLVSRQTRAKASGPAHNKTIYKMRPKEDGGIQTYERKPVFEMTLDDLRRVPNPDRNASLIETLRETISELDPNVKKRKAKDFTPPVGPSGAIVRKVTLLRDRNQGISVRGGLAQRDTLVRIDIFKHAKKFYAEPIYLHQIADKKAYPDAPLPKTSKGKVISNDDFVLSIHRKDFVITEHPKNGVSAGNYSAFDINSDRLKLEPIDGDKVIRVGVRSLSSIRKGIVDRIGNINLVTKEKRTWRGKVYT